MEINNNKPVQIEVKQDQQLNNQNLIKSINILNYNIEQLNAKQKETNHHLKEIRLGIDVIIFLIILPMIIKILLCILELRTLNDFFELLRA